MAELDRAALNEFVNTEIVKFHQKRLARLRRLKLDGSLTCLAVYNYRSRRLYAAGDLAEAIIADHLAAVDKKLLDAFLIDTAVTVATHLWQARNPSLAGVHLEFVRDRTFFLVSLRAQCDAILGAEATAVAKTLRKAKLVYAQQWHGPVELVVGVCLGHDRVERHENGHTEVAGQAFWTFLSGDETLYARVVSAMMSLAASTTKEFDDTRAGISNLLAAELLNRFRRSDFSIDWDGMVLTYCSGECSSLRSGLVSSVYNQSVERGDLQ
jgi:hypothetical protein